MTTIPDEAIEAAARAWASGSPSPNNWENMTSRLREMQIARMRAALTAAAPHIEKAVRADERERIAAEVKALVERMDNGKLNAFNNGVMYAARIAQGEHR